MSTANWPANSSTAKPSTAITRGCSAWRTCELNPIAPDEATFGTNSSIAASTRTPTKTMPKNPPRQPTSCPTSVPSGTPNAVETANPPITTDIARPIRSGDTTPMPIVMATATTRPCNAPVSTRAIRSTVKSELSAITAVIATYAAIADSSTSRLLARTVTAVRTGPPIAWPRA